MLSKTVEQNLFPPFFIVLCPGSKGLPHFYSVFSPPDLFHCVRLWILAASRLSIPGRAISAGL